MAKINKRFSIKANIDFENNELTEYDKEIGEVKHSLSDIFKQFSNIDDVTLTLSHDEMIEGKQE